MVEVRPLTADDFPEVYAKYLAEDDALSTADDWRRLFDVSLRFADCGGYGLVDAGRIVGMAGMLFSKRTIDGRSRRFCNLHSWKVDPPYRGFSLMLLRPALTLRSHTLVDFTPTPHVVRIHKRLGFEPLDSRLMLLFPRRCTAKRASPITLVTDPGQIAARFDEPQAKLARDHQGLGFIHLVAETERGACHVVASRVTRHLFPYCHIYHVSCPALFREFHGSICRRLLELTGTRFAAADVRRIGPERLPSSIIVPVSTNQLYRSDSVMPADVDPLYSELTYLRLTTLPNKRCVLRHLRHIAGGTPAKVK